MAVSCNNFFYALGFSKSYQNIFQNSYKIGSFECSIQMFRGFANFLKCSRMFCMVLSRFGNFPWFLECLISSWNLLWYFIFGKFMYRYNNRSDTNFQTLIVCPYAILFRWMWMGLAYSKLVHSARTRFLIFNLNAKKTNE